MQERRQEQLQGVSEPSVFAPHIPTKISSAVFMLPAWFPRYVMEAEVPWYAIALAGTQTQMMTVLLSEGSGSSSLHWHQFLWSALLLVLQVKNKKEDLKSYKIYFSLW